MSEFQRINVINAVTLIEQENAVVADIRDPQSFAIGHIPNAWSLGQHNLQQFMNAVEFETPVIVSCYHGVSSQGVAAWLAEQGYEKVYSLDGGFAAWSVGQAVESGAV